jgi:hypothetical protein
VSQSDPAEQLQALWQSNPKKPAGQAVGRGGGDWGTLPCPQGPSGPPPACVWLTSLTEASSPASWAGAGPTDMVTGCPMLTLAPLLTARPKVALGTS